ncbi:MAG: electron transfer flavoprotein subunit alpha/FixB family protein [Oscillospiraceae bacterium]|jgi:electron transfer flavoprotein alpha subunit|nr:electron transfer flavoprotein subunit alpha/FixB family protein [Oscillospiraceae bacterium]
MKTDNSHDLWRGIAVFAQTQNGDLHDVSLELLGKALELARVINHPVYALVIGYNVGRSAEKLVSYGADKVYVYDEPCFEHYTPEPYAAAFSDFINEVRPSSILVGTTSLGRSLAPRVAARFKTGLTADCTLLDIKENTDLMQIRPAYGGNIMAQIITPRHRPQMCTVRQKVFKYPKPARDPKGEIITKSLPAQALHSRVEVLDVLERPRDVDIMHERVLIAVGKGIKSEKDISLIRDLCTLLDAQICCTRPLVEQGWFDAKRQVGVSGRTVAPELILTLGVSGSVQFTTGMRGSACIVAVNSDPAAPIFDIAHYGLCCDLYEIVPLLIDSLKPHGAV